VPYDIQTVTFLNRDGENLESSMFIKNVRSLPRSIFLMHYLELCLESLAFQKIASSASNAFPVTNHLLTKFRSDSIYQVEMILYA